MQQNECVNSAGTHRCEEVVLQVQCVQRVQLPAEPHGNVFDPVVGQVQTLQTGHELQSLNPPVHTHTHTGAEHTLIELELHTVTTLMTQTCGG